MSGVTKPKPLKVFGRSHYACTRCKLAKIKCSGEKPSCSNCHAVNKSSQCTYPTKDRKVVIMESDLNKLLEKIETLESNHSFQSHDPSSFINHFNQTFDSSDHSLSPPNFNSPVDQPFSPQINNLLNQLNFDQLADFQNSNLQFTLMDICFKSLPPKPELIKLVTKVYNTYSREFYLISWPDLMDDVDYIYQILLNPQSNKLQLQKTNNIGEIHTLLCYIFVLLAFGHQLSYRPSTHPHDFKYPGIDYYLLAEYLLHLTKEDITVIHIQSALLLGLYAANLSRYNTVYNYFGIAIRSAVSLNLHRKRDSVNVQQNSNTTLGTQISNSSTSSKSCSNSTLKDKVIEENHKRLWWSVFVIEIIWATKTVHFQYTDTDVDLPNENVFALKNDPFETKTLEDNVHLTKYVAKFIRLIYGPNMRTFSINYINTNQFNQKLLLTNIIKCYEDLIINVETPVLNQYINVNCINNGSRTIANLILRYHQALVLISTPLIPLLYESSVLSTITQNCDIITQILKKTCYAACATIKIVAKLYLTDTMFLLGFWDSQHLFCSILFLVLIKVEDIDFSVLSKGIAVLKFMAQNHNVNAGNKVAKLFQIKSLLSANGIELDLESTIDTAFATPLVNCDNPEIGSFLPYLNQTYIDEIELLPKMSFNHKNYDEDKRRSIARLINKIQDIQY